VQNLGGMAKPHVRSLCPGSINSDAVPGYLYSCNLVKIQTDKMYDIKAEVCKIDNLQVRYWLIFTNRHAEICWVYQRNPSRKILSRASNYSENTSHVLVMFAS